MLSPLHKEGYLTDEERKLPLSHACEYMMFHTNMDLTLPIRLTLYGDSKEITLKRYTEDIMNFTAWWRCFVAPKLNGFSGFHHVTFECVNFKVLPQ